MWNVLIVEDDKDCYQKILQILKGRARATIAVNGEGAIEAYRKSINSKKHFDFVLLDVTMSGIDGFEVLKTIRAEEEKRSKNTFKSAYVIMITTYKDSLMEHYNMGWDDFITKPVEGEKLISHMQELIKKPREVQS